MDEDTKPGLMPAVSAAQTEAILEIPAPFVNWFFTHRSPMGLRVSFAERGAAGTLPHPRAAVMISYGDLHLLRTLLDNVITAYDQEIADLIAGNKTHSDGD